VEDTVWSDWKRLEAAFAASVDADFEGWIGADQPHHPAQLEFAHSRLAEGRDLARSLGGIRRMARGPLLCLDIGGGNGGVALGLANFRRMRVHTTDLAPNVTMSRAVRSAGLPISRTLARVGALPYADETFDVALLIDVVEHVRERRRMGSEVMRVLKPGGLCFITTPARLRYVFRPDPHYGIGGLLLLPNFLQRFVVDRVLRRRHGGAESYRVPAYDVEHTFWHVDELARLFPGRAEVQALYGFPLQPEPIYTREGLRTALRNFVFHHVLIWKAEGRRS
jgi:2-polyprenyl-3-methyl-5-hydroxy-6-metoxy-1,4-benzoquinol methylase